MKKLTIEQMDSLLQAMSFDGKEDLVKLHVQKNHHLPGHGWITNSYMFLNKLSGKELETILNDICDSNYVYVAGGNFFERNY